MTNETDSRAQNIRNEALEEAAQLVDRIMKGYEGCDVHLIRALALTARDIRALKNGPPTRLPDVQELKNWMRTPEGRKALGLPDKEPETTLTTTSDEAFPAPGTVHSNHPNHHYDRSCGACIAERDWENLTEPPMII